MALSGSAGSARCTDPSENSFRSGPYPERGPTARVEGSDARASHRTGLPQDGQ